MVQRLVQEQEWEERKAASAACVAEADLAAVIAIEEEAAGKFETELPYLVVVVVEAVAATTEVETMRSLRRKHEAKTMSMLE